MFNKSFVIVLACLISCFSVVFAFTDNEAETKNAVTSVVAETAPEFDAKKLKAVLKTSLGLPVENVMETEFPGIALVVTNQGLFYASYDGKFFIQGKIYQLTDGVSDISDASLAKIRLAGMDKFADDMIVYPAKDEQHVITVFTDITCGYCRKMHNQMAQYNALGITVRYLPYPRAGVVDKSGELSQGFKDLRSIWCHEDAAGALTNAKAGGAIEAKVCEKPIEAEFNFGRQVGVSGTPAIMLSNGSMIPGYQEPNKLIEVLKTL